MSVLLVTHQCWIFFLPDFFLEMKELMDWLFLPPNLNFCQVLQIAKSKNMLHSGTLSLCFCVSVRTYTHGLNLDLGLGHCNIPRQCELNNCSHLLSTYYGHCDELLNFSSLGLPRIGFHFFFYRANAETPQCPKN